MWLYSEEAPLPWDLSCSALTSIAPLALWKSPFLAVQREISRERTGQGGSGSGLKGWRTSLTSRSLSITIHIYSRRRKDRRLFLSNFLIKSCQSCLNADHFMALVIKGRKYPVIKFMRLDRKPNWNSFANPLAKWFISLGLENLFLSPLFCQLLISSLSLNSCDFLRGAD